MRRFLTFIAAVVLGTSAFGQAQPNLAPLSASGPAPFSVSSNAGGAIEDVVNLHTGDLQFPLTLAKLPGRNGLGADVSIMYSSNVSRQANTWNVEAPTGVVGLGWSLSYPQIVVDNKMTGTREDDTYYLLEGGAMNKLIYVGTSSDKIYRLQNYQFWTITYYSLSDKWEITKEDGTKYVFGDINSGRSTVQWTVHWNNWMGSSNVIQDQEQQAVAWNLSEITNIWQEKIVYSYQNINQQTGVTTGKEHTEASYLSHITGLDGQSIDLVYGDKLDGEYVEPHRENGVNQIDAYQERYETKYLDYLTVQDRSGLLYKVDLSYSVIGTGNMQKRLLETVVQYNNLNESLPGYKFEYLTTYDANTNTGALKRITTPSSGSTAFDYVKESAGRSMRDKVVTAISGFSEPKVWMGQDYVVVSRRALAAGNVHSTDAQNVRFQVFNWDGEWLEWQNGSKDISGITVLNKDGGTSSLTDQVYDYQNFFVTVQKDFFAILARISGSSYNVWIYRKDERTRNKWYEFSAAPITLTTDLRKESLVSGENFVAVAGNKSDIFRFTWNASTSTWTQSTIDRVDNNVHNPLAAGQNYIISHERGSGPINFHFLKEDGTWLTKRAAALPTPPTGASYWYPAATFAVVMANSNTERIYRWDENYEMITPFNTLEFINDESYVDIINNSMVSIVQPLNGTGYTWRFNGLNWISSTVMDYGGIDLTIKSLFSYGDDFVVRPRSSSLNIGLRTFNPNTGTWTDQDLPTANKLLLFAGSNYFVKVDDSDATKANVYIRQNSGSFVKDPVSVTGLKTSTGTSSGLPEARFGWQGGSDFVVKSINNAVPAVCQALSIRFKNGKIDANRTGFVTTDFNSGCPLFSELGTFDATRMLVSGNTIVPFLGPSSGNVNQSEATEVRLNKLLDDDATGSLSDFHVKLVTTNDGIQNYSTYIQFDASKATYDASGTVCQYNKATVFPGVTTGDPRNGYTEYYFFNGLSNAEVGSTFPDFPDNSVEYNTNARVYTGLPYRKRILNSSLAVVSETVTQYAIYDKTIVSGFSYFLRPSSVLKSLDGRTTYVTSTYSTVSGQLSSESMFVKSPTQGLLDEIKTEYKYWYEAYDGSLSRNILTPLIQVKRSVKNQVTDVTATRFKYWGTLNNIPSAYQTYQWKRQNSPDFTAWSQASAVSADWKLLNANVVMDEFRGLVKEFRDNNDVPTTIIYSPYAPNVIAQAERAASSDVFYNGFEDFTTNSSTDAIMGNKSFTGSFTAFLPSTQGAYKLSYWKKDPSKDWEFVEQPITGSMPIGGNGTLIDEIRIQPVNSVMTTYSYDRVGNVTGKNDLNNHIEYREYDSFHRLKVIRDKDRNITQQIIYKIN